MRARLNRVLGKVQDKALAAMSAAGVALLSAGGALASTPIGQPEPGGIGLQKAAAPLKHDAIWFHDWILMPIISIIVIVVLILLVWIVVRYNRKANPTPARWSHNTVIELIWTGLPVLILVFVALFSFKLLFKYEETPEGAMVVKVTGNQWNWSYEYPDHGVGEYVSVMLPEAEALARNVPYRLAADQPLVVPVGQPVQMLVTASDVIHAVALPAFGLKVDAIPGRTNATWFTAEREGVYYGQCSELCGVDHAFMPIEIHVVSQAAFEAWIASKGGSMPGAEPEAAPEAVPAVAAEAPAVDAPAAPAATTSPATAPAAAPAQ